MQAILTATIELYTATAFILFSIAFIHFVSTRTRPVVLPIAVPATTEPEAEPEVLTVPEAEPEPEPEPEPEAEPELTDREIISWAKAHKADFPDMTKTISKWAYTRKLKDCERLLFLSAMRAG